MILTVKNLIKAFQDDDPNKVIHFWFREKEECEHGGAYPIELDDWKRITDFECRIENSISEIMEDLIDDDSQRSDYPAWVFE